MLVTVPAQFLVHFLEERRQEWICHTCDSHLKRGSMPSIAVANKLELPPIPAELLELNVLERQLIAKIVPFAKIVALPKDSKDQCVAVLCVCPLRWRKQSTVCQGLTVSPSFYR